MQLHGEITRKIPRSKIQEPRTPPERRSVGRANKLEESRLKKNPSKFQKIKPRIKININLKASIIQFFDLKPDYIFLALSIEI